MKKLILPIVGLLLLSACANGATVTKISADKAKEMMDLANKQLDLEKDLQKQKAETIDIAYVKV